MNPGQNSQEKIIEVQQHASKNAFSLVGMRTTLLFTAKMIVISIN